ncbi:MAG TPA: cytochrome P450 [Candidatus Nitrosocosmicus sp.]|nr:cytochrome P450 [Candidatus Nitrosocosmicus sp.]
MVKVEIVYPPGPSSKVPGKMLRQFLRDPLKTFFDIATEYGDISHFRLGKKDSYLINNPDYIEKILIYDHRIFKKGQRLQTAKRMLGEGLVTSEGKMHDNQKRFIHPFFIPKKINSFGPIMSGYAVEMCNQWKNGSVIDIHKEMTTVTFSIICKAMMDYDMRTSEDAQKFVNSFTSLKKYSNRLQHPLGRILDNISILPKVAENKRAEKTMNDIVYQLISQKRNETSNNNTVKPTSSSKSESKVDLLSGLLEIQVQQQQHLHDGKTNDDDGDSNDETSSMMDKQIRDHLITMLIAGHETTANALTWTYYLLAQHPEIEKKLFEEIDSILSTKTQTQQQNATPENNTRKLNRSYRNVTSSDVPKLKYVEKVFREAMRLYPPVWTIGRIVEEEYKIGDYTIPKESALFMSQYVMHRNPKYYDNPEVFNPDRWTDEFKRQLPRFSYFPFGGGLRGCIGEPFAWQEGIMLITTISSYWKMNLHPDQKVKIDHGATLNPKNGIKMILEARNN